MGAGDGLSGLFAIAVTSSTASLDPASIYSASESYNEGTCGAHQWARVNMENHTSPEIGKTFPMLRMCSFVKAVYRWLKIPLGRKETPCRKY